MRVLVAGGAGFIGSALRAPAASSAHPGRLRAGARQAHLRRPAREPRGAARRPGSSSWTATSPTSSAVAEARRGLRRDRQLRRRVARRPLDRVARASSSRPTSSAPSCCSRPRATAGIRHLQVSTDEVYGSIESGSFTEQSPLEPSSPVLGVEGGRRPDRRRLPPHLRRRRADRARVQQLRPAPAPGEADPALRPERARRRPAARSTATACRSATGSSSRTSAAAIDTRARARRGRRGLQRRRPGRAPQHRRRQDDPGADGPRRVADRVRRRIASATTAATRSRRSRREALGWEPEVVFDEGLERTVEWYRDNEWWWEPIRSGEYREYYERQYGRSLG